MSRRPRKTDHGVTDFNALLRAIKDVKVEKKAAKSIARAYDIPKTSFYRYIEKFDKKIPDITQVADDVLVKTVKEIASYSTPSLVFNSEEEGALEIYILRCCAHYYGLSINELRKLAYQFASKIHVNYPRSWNEKKMAGWSWYYAFMKRHGNLSLRTPEQTSLNRVKSFCRENVATFFHNLMNVTNKTTFSPDSIYNMDETGLSTVPSKVGKVISLKGTKRVGQVAAQERGTMITMAIAVNAAGNSIPPFFLFPRKKMQAYFMDHGPTGAVGFANESGWMQQAEFIKFMTHFVKFSRSSTDSPTLLLLDNHASHLSVEAIDIAAENCVTLLSFPPHCSHRMQPLDVSVYGPLKAFYQADYQTWKNNHVGQGLDIRNITSLLVRPLDRALMSENIKADF